MTTDTIDALWAHVAKYDADTGDYEAEQIAAQRAVLGRLVDAYQDAADEGRGLFLAWLLSLAPERKSGYTFHLWCNLSDEDSDCWMAIRPPDQRADDADPHDHSRPWCASPRECFEKLYAFLATKIDYRHDS